MNNKRLGWKTRCLFRLDNQEILSEGLIFKHNLNAEKEPCTQSVEKSIPGPGKRNAKTPGWQELGAFQKLKDLVAGILWFKLAKDDGTEMNRS